MPAHTMPKLQNERNQLLIGELLRDDENKYCADCDGKAPRWASWNIGVLLCIRCAGIHRGLGVHISKIKSLTLDSWEPSQLAMLCEIGNRRGRQIYEANLPNSFIRPQSDSSLEQFIRAKYQQKRYIDSNFIQPNPDATVALKEINRIELANKKHISSAVLQIAKPLNVGAHITRNHKGNNIEVAKSTVADILGLATTTNSVSIGPAAHSTHTNSQPNMPDTIAATTAIDDQQTAKSNNFLDNDLMGLHFGSALPPAAVPDFGWNSTSKPASERRQTTKESILALYNQNHTSAGDFHIGGGVNNFDQRPFVASQQGTYMNSTLQPNHFTALNSTWQTNLSHGQRAASYQQGRVPTSMETWPSTTQTKNDFPVFNNSAPISVTASYGYNVSAVNAQQSYLTQIQDQLATLHLQK